MDVLPFWFGESHRATAPEIRQAGAAALERGETFYAPTLGLATLRGSAIPSAFSDFARGGIPIGGAGLALPDLTAVALAVLFIVWLLLEHTVYGRRLYAIGETSFAG